MITAKKQMKGALKNWDGKPYGETRKGLVDKLGEPTVKYMESVAEMTLSGLRQKKEREYVDADGHRHVPNYTVYVRGDVEPKAMVPVGRFTSKEKANECIDTLRKWGVVTADTVSVSCYMGVLIPFEPSKGVKKSMQKRQREVKAAFDAKKVR